MRKVFQALGPCFCAIFWLHRSIVPAGDDVQGRKAGINAQS